MRQIDLAGMVSAFQSEIFEIKCGKRVTSVYLAKRIAEVLGVSLDDLFFIP